MLVNAELEGNYEFFNRISNYLNNQFCQEHYENIPHKICYICLESNNHWKNCIFCEECYQSHSITTGHHHYGPVQSIVPAILMKRLDEFLEKNILKTPLNQYITNLVDKLYSDHEIFIINQLKTSKQNFKTKINIAFLHYSKNDCKNLVQDLKTKIQNNLNEIKNSNNGYDAILQTYFTNIQFYARENEEIISTIKTVEKDVDDIINAMSHGIKDCQTQIITSINELENKIQEQLKKINKKISSTNDSLTNSEKLRSPSPYSKKNTKVEYTNNNNNNRLSSQEKEKLPDKHVKSINIQYVSDNTTFDDAIASNPKLLIKKVSSPIQISSTEQAEYQSGMTPLRKVYTPNNNNNLEYPPFEFKPTSTTEIFEPPQQIKRRKTVIYGSRESNKDIPSNLTYNLTNLKDDQDKSEKLSRVENLKTITIVATYASNTSRDSFSYRALDENNQYPLQTENLPINDQKNKYSKQVSSILEYNTYETRKPENNSMTNRYNNIYNNIYQFEAKTNTQPTKSADLIGYYDQKDNSKLNEYIIKLYIKQINLDFKAKSISKKIFLFSYSEYQDSMKKVLIKRKDNKLIETNIFFYDLSDNFFILLRLDENNNAKIISSSGLRFDKKINSIVTCMSGFKTTRQKYQTNFAKFEIICDLIENFILTTSLNQVTIHPIENLHIKIRERLKLYIEKLAEVQLNPKNSKSSSRHSNLG